MRMLLSRVILAPALAALGACGGGSGTPSPDAPVAHIDATPTVDAAGIDAAPPADAPPTTVDAAGRTEAQIKEVTAGSGHVAGATYEVDVQLGHWHGQEPASGWGKTIEGAAAVKP